MELVQDRYIVSTADNRSSSDCRIITNEDSMTVKVSLVGLYLERFDLDIGIDFKNTKSHESNGVDVTHITSAV